MRRLLTLGHSYVVAANRRLAHEMARAGAGTWEVTAAAPEYFHGTRDLRPNRLEPLPDEPCRLVPVGARLTKRIHLFVYGRRMRRLLGEGWDVVHCWEEPFIVAGGQLAAWTPREAKLVYRTAQSIPKRYPPPLAQIERFALRRAAGWICSGRLVEDALGSRPGYRDTPMRRIPLGVDATVFRPDPERRRAALRELGWEPGPPVVGYLGRFAPEKGLDVLTRALDAVEAPWRALLLGAGPEERKLRAWAARYPDRVRIRTDVRHDGVPPFVNAMDVLAAPSQTTPRWKEQFGRMLVEAFASKVAVIGSDSGEIPFVIGDDGLVVGETDVPGWSEALTALLTDADRREELAERGYAKAQQHFTWPVVAAQYLAFFDELQRGSAE